MVKKKLYYLAHAVASNELNTYEENIEDGKKWWKALIRSGIIVCAPWLGLCSVLDDREDADRKLGMAIDKEVLKKCDGVILAGPFISKGMQEEWDLAFEAGKTIYNLTGKDIKDGIEMLKILIKHT